MKVINGVVYPDSGKYLKIKTCQELYSEIILGPLYIFDGKSTNLVDVKAQDITEVYTIKIGNEYFYVSSTTYPELVTELIRKRYSLDDELALMANSRLDENGEKEIEFQNWRKLCKETAKKVLNE